MSEVPDQPPRLSLPETVELSSVRAGAEDAPSAAAAPIDATFGDYELLGEIARGGMGVVYRARERLSGRLVALKMMLDESASSPADLQRFAQEAQATAELQHPGIVALHAWGVHQGHPFFTMDLVAGRSLDRVLADGPLPIDRAVHYLVGIARALGAAHALGIVHRDLKPSNIMIDAADQPRLLDFGLAKRRRTVVLGPAADEPLTALPADAPAPPMTEKSPLPHPHTPRRGLGSDAMRRATPPPSAPLTEKGAILGTPSYMAPEQVRAEHDRIGPTADVHALGALFFEMLTGRPPFHGDSTYATLIQVLEQKPPSVRSLRPEVPPTIDTVLRRCLAKEPGRRYPNGTALADDLEQRWRRWQQAQRFARLALLALAAVVALQVVQPLLVAGAVDDQGGFVQLVEPAVRPDSPLWAGAAVLDRLVMLGVVLAGPMLGGVGLMTWAAAWAWCAARPWRLWVGWLLAASAGLAAWWLVRRTDLPWGSIFLPWLLWANAAGVGITFLLRRRLRPARDWAGGGGGESYLQKLFAVRGTARPRKAALADGRSADMADFELGTLIHSWEHGAVHWARQRSLDRAVLVWRDGCPPTGAPPGVVVRHPDVLSLHAVGASPEGRLLVTEATAASPLAEVLRQRPLTSGEAITLAARLADAVQAFHDQGASHGRLAPEWVLVRGDLEPVLCPCGIPDASEADRVADVQALGRLLLGWLPPRPRLWRLEALAPVYQTCDAACAGTIARADELADLLRRAARAGVIAWRERAVGVGLLLLVLLPWLVFAVGPPVLIGAPLMGLCAAAALFGYAEVRAEVQRWRLGGTAQVRLLLRRRSVRLAGALALVGLALGVGAMVFVHQTGLAWSVLPRLLGLLAGYATIGAAIALGVTFGELLAQSVRTAALPTGGRPD